MFISIWDNDVRQWSTQEESHGCVVDKLLAGEVIRTNIHDGSDPAAEELDVWVRE